MPHGLQHNLVVHRELRECSFERQLILLHDLQHNLAASPDFRRWALERPRLMLHGFSTISRSA